jgi:hypothetical protein
MVYYVFAISLVVVVSYVATKFKTPFEESKDEYALIKQYLLNDSPLEGYKKPKIWIHTKYEYNSRLWSSFHGRSSYDLNQPYIHLTIKSIIDQCGDDFQVCLIDDDTFSKLIPSWDIDLHLVAEPMKSWIRSIGLAELVYYYGGMVVPNSFVCFSSLIDVYLNGTAGDRPFVVEKINQKVNLPREGPRMAFIPGFDFMGAPKNDETVKALVQYMKTRIQTPHFSSERDFLGEMEYWCLDCVDRGSMNLVGGEIVGIKTTKKKAIVLENLMEEEYLALSSECVGVYIPEDEILARTKYQWFAVMPTRQILESNFILSKYLKVAMLHGAKNEIPKRIRKTIQI